MGNTWFLGSAGDPYQGTNEAIGFWLGPAKGGFDMHLPSCSDELIDWTDEATQILRLFLQKGVSRQFAKSRPDSKRKYLKLSIKPLVLASSTQECQHLPSLGLIERVRFFAENVSLPPRKGIAANQITSSCCAMSRWLSWYQVWTSHHSL